MKTIQIVLLALAIALVTVVGVCTVKANAEDVLINGKISTVTQRLSKSTGEPYTILTIPEEKVLNGVKYTADTSVFCFKSEQAKTLKQGDPVKLIARKTKKDGNEFTTLIVFVK